MVCLIMISKSFFFILCWFFCAISGKYREWKEKEKKKWCERGTLLGDALFMWCHSQAKISLSKFDIVRAQRDASLFLFFFNFIFYARWTLNRPITRIQVLSASKSKVFDEHARRKKKLCWLQCLDQRCCCFCLYKFMLVFCCVFFNGCVHCTLITFNLYTSRLLLFNMFFLKDIL